MSISVEPSVRTFFFTSALPTLLTTLRALSVDSTSRSNVILTSLLHVWAKKFEPLLMFFKMPILTLNNVVWMLFSAILFGKAQHVVKISTTGYVPVFYEVINLFIKVQNFLLMGWYLIIFFFNGLLMFFLHFVCELPSNLWEQYIKTVSSEVFCLWYVDLKTTAHTSLPH